MHGALANYRFRSGRCTTENLRWDSARYVTQGNATAVAMRSVMVDKPTCMSKGTPTAATADHTNSPAADHTGHTDKQ